MTRRTLIKGIAIALITPILLIIVAITIVMNFVITPARVTPIVLSSLQEQVATDVSLQQVDVRFFSTFPRLTIEVDSLRIPREVDTIADLVVAEKCILQVSPLALLKRAVVVDKFLLQGAAINLYVDEEHRIKDLLIASAEEEIENDTIQRGALKGYRFAIDQIEVDSAVIVVEDRTKDFYSKIDGLSIGLSVRLSPKRSRLSAEVELKNWEIVHNGRELLGNTAIRMNTEMSHRRDSMLLTIDESFLRINKIGMRVEGSVRRDTLNDGLDVNIRGGLRTSSLAEITDLIPSLFIEDKNALTTSGKVHLNARCEGLYNETSLPSLWAKFSIEEGAVTYGEEFLPLENIACQAASYIDFNQPDSSYVKIKNFHLSSSDIIDISFDGKIENMLQQPYIDANIRSYVDFDRFTEIFPLQEGVVLKGSNSSDLHAQFALVDIEQKNYGNLYIDGKSDFDQVYISIDGEKFFQDSTLNSYLFVEMERGTLLFGDRVKSNNSRTLLSTINFTGVGFKDRYGQYGLIKDFALTAGANFDNKTKKVNGVGVKTVIQNTNVGIVDIIDVKAETSDITLTIVPETEERKATIKALATCATVTATDSLTNSTLSLSHANFNLNLERQEKREWSSNGTVGFADLDIYTDLFPLPIRVPNSAVSLGENKVILENTQLEIGESALTATGYISNLIRMFFLGENLTVSGELAINSPLLNMDELIVATNQSVIMNDTTGLYSDDTIVDTTVVADTTSLMILVPRKVEFALDLNIDKMIYNNTSIDSIKGNASIKRGTLTLEQLTLQAIGAEVTTSMVYQNIKRDSASISLNMNLAQVDITRIGELMPTIDSMMPMLQSFEGIVDFDIKAQSNLNNQLEFDFNTLKSAISFTGKELVLMDSETFAQLSKYLLFKNKDRNLVDSLGVYALIEKRNIEVLPFEMSIDRYQAIIGGKQTVDEKAFEIDYNYNVSILKSPLPFKAGVDIKGNLNDFNFKITTAKLKNTNFEEQAKRYNDHYDSIIQKAKYRKPKPKREEQPYRQDSLRVEQPLLGDSIANHSS